MTRTLRILNLDGGGCRVYIGLQFLKMFCSQWGINFTDLHKYFDVICGTSAGGIASLYISLAKTLEEAESFFTDNAKYIFSTVPIIAHRATMLEKLAFIAADTPIYNSVDDSYGHLLLYKTIDEALGANTTMQAVKTNVLIPIYELDTNTYRIFSNVNYPEFTGNNELMRNVAIGTGSAPIYLPSIDFNNHTYIDGGVFQNNPSNIGLSLAKSLKPVYDKICLLSIGSGLRQPGFQDEDNTINHDVLEKVIKNNNNFKNLSSYEGLTVLFNLFNIGMTGAQESVHQCLKMESKYSLNNLYYYRFQPILDDDKITELDNGSDDILEYYENLVEENYNNEIADITAFLSHLTA